MTQCVKALATQQLKLVLSSTHRTHIKVEGEKWLHRVAYDFCIHILYPYTPHIIQGALTCCMFAHTLPSNIMQILKSLKSSDIHCRKLTIIEKIRKNTNQLFSLNFSHSSSKETQAAIQGECWRKTTSVIKSPKRGKLGFFADSLLKQ